MEIDKSEVLRYLGYRNQALDKTMENLIHECLAEIKDLMQKKYVYFVYDLEREADTIRLKDTNLVIRSKDLSRHLCNSDKCALMAATLGLEVDKRLNFYSRFNLTKGIVLDACATTAIEALCDELEAEIALEAKKQGYYITSRYSPGYGDVPLIYQKEILEVLKAYPKIGLTVTENCIMLPRKSVTAFIGWQKEKGVRTYKCSSCQEKNCLYRKCGVING